MSSKLQNMSLPTATKKKKVSPSPDVLSLFTSLKDDKFKQDQLDELILKNVPDNEGLLSFIKKHIDLYSDNNHITSTSTLFNLKKLYFKEYSSIINIKKINDVRYINKFFEGVNEILPDSGLYFGTVETYPNRRKALLDKYPFIINRIVYTVDFLFNRLFPKLSLTKKLYFYLTKGRGRVMSRAETYGRLYCCGFEVIDEKSINNSLYFIAKKTKEPFYDQDPTYGPLLRLRRVGFGGKLIKVFKLRTMHPFSEYLQEYVYNKNKLQGGGKIKDDFRISPEGRIFRKIWLDEIPMIYNVLKGEMKIVGVRPLSPHFYSLYDKNLQELRIQTKPGLIPPFYADMPETLEEIMASEKRYLKAYLKRPLYTDFSYFLKALYNILIKRKRSA